MCCLQARAEREAFQQQQQAHMSQLKQAREIEKVRAAEQVILYTFTRLNMTQTLSNRPFKELMTGILLIDPPMAECLRLNPRLRGFKPGNG